jgi:hypothetical protein
VWLLMLMLMLMLMLLVGMRRPAALLSHNSFWQDPTETVPNRQQTAR